MATIKARFPVWKAEDAECGVSLGRMMSVSVAPTYEQTSRLGGSKLIFTGATVSLNTTHLPMTAYKEMFDAGTENGSKLADKVLCGKRGAFLYITGELIDGEPLWVLHELKSVQFVPPAESAVTKGAQVSFTSPSITGEAKEVGNVWRVRQYFGTAAAAIAKLKEQAGWNEQSNL